MTNQEILLEILACLRRMESQMAVCNCDEEYTSALGRPGYKWVCPVHGQSTMGVRGGELE
jgi:hypothetical protein